MRRTVTVAAGLLLILGLAVYGGTTASAQQRLTVAVMPFEASVSPDFARMDVGRQLTNLVTDQLVNSGEFDLVEREKVRQLLDEQDFGASGRVDPSHAVEIGRLLGAQVLVFGSVTQFEMSGGAGISIGGFSLSGTTGKAALSGRIVDAATGAILGSAEGRGEATGATFSVQNVDGVNFQASEFQNSALGRAVVRAVDGFVAEMSGVIEDNKERVFDSHAASEVQGVVLALIDNGVVFNLGSDDGVRREQRFSVFRLLEIEGLSDPVRLPVAVVNVISVDPGASIALVVSMTQPIEVGDLVERQ